MTITTQLILVVILSIAITLCIVAIGSFSDKTIFNGIKHYNDKDLHVNYSLFMLIAKKKGVTI